MNYIKYLFILAFSLVESSFAGTLVDERDSKSYETVEIDGVEWMAENLSYVKSGECYDGKKANCKKFGALYRYEGNDFSKICPDGWRLPSSSEWRTLLAHGAQDIADKSWKKMSPKPTNSTGFSALPAGVMEMQVYNSECIEWDENSGECTEMSGYNEEEEYTGIEEYASFWTIVEPNEYGGEAPNVVHIYSESEPDISEWFNNDAYSIRCVKEESFQ